MRGLHQSQVEVQDGLLDAVAQGELVAPWDPFGPWQEPERHVVPSALPRAVRCPCARSRFGRKKAAPLPAFAQWLPAGRGAFFFARGGQSPTTRAPDWTGLLRAPGRRYRPRARDSGRGTPFHDALCSSRRPHHPKPEVEAPEVRGAAVADRGPQAAQIEVERAPAQHTRPAAACPR